LLAPLQKKKTVSLSRFGIIQRGEKKGRNQPNEYQGEHHTLPLRWRVAYQKCLIKEKRNRSNWGRGELPAGRNIPRKGSTSPWFKTTHWKGWEPPTKRKTKPETAALRYRGTTEKTVQAVGVYSVTKETSPWGGTQTALKFILGVNGSAGAALH